MARSKLQAALETNGGVNNYVTKTEDFTSSEDLMKAALEARAGNGSDGATRLAQANRRASLLRKAGFDFIDIRELTPNPNNTYSIDDESIEALASLIEETKNTTPIIVRANEEGYEIIDGERRYRAHLLLAQRLGEHYYMIPARCFGVGELSDEDAEFMMHAENIGQRNMTASERAEGIAAVQARIVKARQKDESYKGRATKEILAQQFGISERQVVVESTIGSKLIEQGKELLDSGTITKQEAYDIARLTKTEQEKQCKKLSKLKDKESNKKQIRRKHKTTEEYLLTAKQAFEKAIEAKDQADIETVRELRLLLRQLEP